MYPAVNPYQQALDQMSQYASSINVNLAPFLNSQTGQMQSQAPQTADGGLSPEDQQALAQIQQAQGLSQNGQGGGVPLPDASQMQGNGPVDAQGQPMQQGIPTMPFTYPSQQDIIANRPAFPGLTGGIDYSPPQYRAA